MFQWDWTVHVSDLLVFGGGLWAFFKVFLTVRDALKELTAAVGQKMPPTGLVGEVEHIKLEQQDHRDWLIAAGLDRRHQQHDRRST